MNFNPKYYPPLMLPPAELKVAMRGDKPMVFDKLRDKYVALTPEEYVRQHFVSYLLNHLHYPEGLTANEIGIELNGTKRRCDTVVFDNYARPMMIIEYKAPGVTITQDTFDQIVRYNMVLHAKYLCVSNGLNHYCCVINYETNSYDFIPKVPDWNDLMTPIQN